MQYGSFHAFWNKSADVELWTQHEVDLFARDPEEQFESLAGFVKAADFRSLTLSKRWRDEIDPALVPGSATRFYPPVANWNTPDPVLAQPVPNNFWSGMPQGQGAQPTGTGSIKAVKVVNHGICSKFFSYGPNALLDEIDLAVFTAGFRWFLDRETAWKGAKVCSPYITNFTNLTPFLHQTVEREAAQFGGFFLNSSLQFFTQGQFNVPSLLFHDAYWWRLVDGRLTVEPSRILTVGDDNLNDEPPLEDDFFHKSMPTPVLPLEAPATLAQVVWQQMNMKQVVRSGSKCGEGNVELGRVVEGIVPRDKACGGFIKIVRDWVAKAAPKMSPFLARPFSQLEITDLVDAVDAIETDSRTGLPVYKNFQCVPHGNEPQAKCDFVLHAKRVNVFPDGVELVYVDDQRELANPAYPMWLVMWSLHDPLGAQTTNPLLEMCDLPVSQQQFALNHRPRSGDTDRVVAKVGDPGRPGCTGSGPVM